MIKPTFNLTPEELEMEAAINRDAVRPVTEAERLELQAMARNTIAKNKMITIRLSERTLTRLKAAAMREGLPYQTLVSSLIHKHIS